MDFQDSKEENLPEFQFWLICLEWAEGMQETLRYSSMELCQTVAASFFLSEDPYLNSKPLHLVPRGSDEYASRAIAERKSLSPVNHSKMPAVNPSKKIPKVEEHSLSLNAIPTKPVKTKKNNLVRTGFVRWPLPEFNSRSVIKK